MHSHPTDESHQNRRGRKSYRWRIDKLTMKEKQQYFQEEMAKTAEQFSELLESTGTTKSDVERNSPGAMIIKGWEQLVKEQQVKS